MKKFTFKRLEVHEYPFEVEAENMMEALQKALDGDGDPIDTNGDTFVERYDQGGMSVDEFLRDNPEMNTKENLKAIRKMLDETSEEEFFPSIKDIEEE